jgi:hypothetical protein
MSSYNAHGEVVMPPHVEFLFYDGRFCIGFLGFVPFRLDVFWELDSSSTTEDMVSDSTSLMEDLARSG